MNRGGNDLSVLIKLEIYIRYNPESRGSRDHAQSNKICNLESEQSENWSNFNFIFVFCNKLIYLSSKSLFRVGHKG